LIHHGLGSQPQIMTAPKRVALKQELPHGSGINDILDPCTLNTDLEW